MIPRIATILFPIVVLLGWCLSLQSKVAFGREVRIAIEGYDPRDLLSGHYLRFTPSFSRTLTCPVQAPDATGESMCVCLATSTTDRRYFEGVELLPCSVAKTRCPVFIKGDCDRGRFETDLTRYYIPEEFSGVLATVPSDASALVKVDSAGGAIVTKLLVGDVEIEEFARNKLNEQEGK